MHTNVSAAFNGTASFNYAENVRRKLRAGILRSINPTRGTAQHNRCNKRIPSVPQIRENRSRGRAMDSSLGALRYDSRYFVSGRRTSLIVFGLSGLVGNRRELRICCLSAKRYCSMPTVELLSFSNQFVPFCSRHPHPDACASLGQTRRQNEVGLAGSAIPGSNKEAWDASP